jgi:acid phosphatase type 7
MGFHLGVVVIALAFFSGLSGCDTNESGRLAALKGGSDRPAERGSPLESLQAACGDGAPTRAGEAVMRRDPYLQQVTATSAMLGWVATKLDGARVEVTTIDRQLVTRSGAHAQSNTLRGAGEDQLWAHLDGLLPGTTYCYSLWNGDEQLTMPAGFRTAPSPDSTEPIRLLAFGDSGGGSNDQYALRDQMHTVPHDLMIHTGDVAYDSGTIQAFEDNVFGVYADLLRSIPLFPAAGNHEYDTMQGAPFREVFALPGDSGEKWYSFDWGRVHFAALDTEASYATQAAWLDRDLASTKAPWKIVYLHRPPYSSGMHGSDTGLRAALAPILERHRVQLVLAGHDHNYERMTMQQGVLHVVTGGGGVGTRSVGTSSFTAFSEDVIHFVYAEIGVDELVLHAIDGTGAEFDSVVIPR